MTDLAARVYDIRCYAESCAKELDVPLEAIVEHVANQGGAEIYCQDGDFIGPHELRESIVRFCRQYKFNRLPPEEQAQQLEFNKRHNTWHYDSLKKRLEPFLRHSITFVSAWDAFICSALHVPNPQFAHKFKGSEDEALDTVLRALKERDKTMSPKRAKSEDTDRTTEIQNFVKPLLTELGIYGDPFKTGAAHREAWGMNFAEVCDSDMPLDEVKAKFAKWHEAKKASKELTSYLNGKAGHTEPEAPQPGLFDDLNAVGEKLASLPAAPVKENVVQVDPPETEPEAPPVDEMPSAGDAIPDVAGAPLLAPVETKEGQSQEVAQLYVKLDYVLDETLTYTLEARWSKETGDIWTAKATCRGSEPDERTIPLLKKDIETNLKARKAVEVVLDIEYEPTVDEINAVKNKCYELASTTYPDLTKEQRLEKIKTAWLGKVAIESIKTWGLKGAYDKVHEAFAQVEDTTPNDAEQAANNLFPGMVNDVSDATPKTLTVVDKPQVIQQVPVGNQNLGFRMPNPEQWAFIVSYADFAVRSGFYPGVKDKNQAIVVMIQGFTLGVDPVSSLRGIDPIPSKRGIQLCFRAKLAKALVMRTGYCEEFVVVGDDKKATATVKRKGHPKNVFTFTYEDAETAGLTKRNPDVWGSYTAKMLKNRVITEAVSVEFPEVYFAFSAAVDEDDEEDAA